MTHYHCQHINHTEDNPTHWVRASDVKQFDVRPFQSASYSMTLHPACVESMKETLVELDPKIVITAIN